MHENSEKARNFHNCSFCSFPFDICKHLQLHQSKMKSDLFVCDSKTLEVLNCDFCEFNTTLKVELTEHYRVFNDRKEINEELANILKCYCCKNCDFATHSLLVLAKHKTACTNKTKKFVRDRKKLSAKNDNWYEFRSSGVKMHLCKHCSYQTAFKTGIESHVLFKHTDAKDINWFKCTQCPFKCKNKGILTRHVIGKHTDPACINWVKCGQCTYKAKTKSQLSTHIRRKHKIDNWYKCAQCFFICKGKERLKVHVIKNHIKSEDGGILDRCAIMKFINWLKCGQCVYKAKTKNQLTAHIGLKHVNPQNINWFQCIECDFKCTRKDQLKIHVTLNHTNPDDVKWFKC